MLLKPSLAVYCCFVGMTLFSMRKADGGEGVDRFRGKNGTGLYDTTLFDLPWNESMITRVPLPGIGNGSPVVHQGVIFLQSAEPEDATRYLVAVSMNDGRELWRRSFESKTHHLHKFSSYASSTPCVDSEHVYAAWADPDHTYLKAFSHDGTEKWSRDFGPYRSEHGFGTSPILVDGMVVLLNSQDSDQDGSDVPKTDRVIAVSARNGDTLWETKLPASKVCYGVPAVWEGVRSGKRVKEIICCTTTQGILGIEPATGSIAWNHDCFTQRVCASPLLVQDLVFATHGSGGGRDNLLIAFDLKKQKEHFRIQRSAPYVPSPVAKDGTLFLWADAGILTAVNIEKGSVYWTKRIGGDYSSSPIILNDKLINVSQNGTLHVLKASNKFEKIGEMETQAVVRSTPVAVDGKLLIRGDDQLLVIQAGKNPKQQ